MLKSILINSLYVLSLVAVFFVIENRFEELEMQSMYMKCVAEELKEHELCVTKIENEYQRSL
jgi:hypothetical protein